MAKSQKRSLLLGVAWSGGIGVVIALLTLIAGAGAIPPARANRKKPPACSGAPRISVQLGSGRGRHSN